VFASKQNYDKIVDFKLCDLESEQHKKWMDKKNGEMGELNGVPEEKLPIVKYIYHFMSRKVDP
jgi:hypothetical protein